MDSFSGFSKELSWMRIDLICFFAIALDPDFPYSGSMHAQFFRRKNKAPWAVINKAFEHLANQPENSGVLLLIVMAIVPVYLCCSDLQTRLLEGNIDGEYDWFVFWTSIPYCSLFSYQVLLLPYQTIKS
jgi:hypothetical protein